MALICQHSWQLDHGQSEHIADLYCQDGVLIGVGPDIVGREALRDWARNRARMSNLITRHINTNFLFVWGGADEVEVRSAVTLYRHANEGVGEPMPLLVGDFEDTVVMRNGTWRFRQRKVVVAFARSN